MLNYHNPKRDFFSALNGKEGRGDFRKKLLLNMNQHSYTKQELALLYFPDATPEVASAHLRRWIILCKPLYEQLLKTGYSKWAKGFTPTQVSYIFAYLGEP